MMWNYEGERVKGIYLDDVPVSGLVKKSRVKYGGTVSHHVVLDEGFSIMDGRINRQKGEVVILDHNQVIRLMGGNLE